MFGAAGSGYGVSKNSLFFFKEAFLLSFLIAIDTKGNLRSLPMHPLLWADEKIRPLQSYWVTI